MRVQIPGWFAGERARRLRCTTFGCHQRAIEEIDKIFLRANVEVPNYFLCEFLCETPAVAPLDRKAASEDEGRVQRLLSGVTLVTPFIDREFYKRDYALNWPKPADVEEFRQTQLERIQAAKADASNPYIPPLIPTTDIDALEVQEKYARFGSMTKTRFGERFFRCWLSEPTALAPSSYALGPIDILTDIENQLSKSGLAFLNMYSQLFLPWLMARKEEVVFVGLPIASQVMFYGYLLLVLPRKVEELDMILRAGAERGREGGNKELELGEEFAKGLFDALIKDMYLPTLTLCRNSWEEFIAEWLIGRNERAIRGPFWRRERGWPGIAAALDRLAQTGELQFVSLAKGWLGRSPTSLERRLESPLVKLWRRRLNRVGTDPEEVRKSLVFARYMVASPGMIRVIRDVMSVNARRSGRPLATVLIVGQPGSGKDEIAQLVPWTSEHYFGTPIEFMNMASLRPNAAAGALMMGVALGIPAGHRVAAEPLVMSGLFLRAASYASGPRTFILDELNSLDTEAQGILLRLLEKGEVAPIGSTSQQFWQESKWNASKELPNLDWLVIGVVNEPPGLLTRESVLAGLQDSAVFGELVGGLLYEVMRKSRRLRDDLYHRLRRGGEIRIPTLKERRVDIPALVYALVVNDVGLRLRDSGEEARSQDHEDGTISGDGIDFQYGAFEHLTDPRIPWDGNVRQAQVVSKHLARMVVEEREGSPRKRVRIDRGKILKALADAKLDLRGLGIPDPWDVAQGGSALVSDS